MKRKLLGLIVITVLLTGCWDQRELADISIVTGMAVDKGKNEKYKLTIEAINATELNAKTASGNSPSIVYSLEGNTVAELAYKMNIGVSKSLIYSHMRVFVMSKDIASSGMMAFLDSFERSRDLRDDFDIVVAKEGKAADILQVFYVVQKSPSLKMIVAVGTWIPGMGI